MASNRPPNVSGLAAANLGFDRKTFMNYFSAMEMNRNKVDIRMPFRKFVFAGLPLILWSFTTTGNGWAQSGFDPSWFQAAPQPFDPAPSAAQPAWVSPLTTTAADSPWLVDTRAQAVRPLNGNGRPQAGVEPGWSPVVIARGEFREQVRSLPIEQRPYRPLHFYGNTVRRLRHRGTPLPTASETLSLPARLLSRE